jgi:iron complex transport system ATP-binding protein
MIAFEEVRIGYDTTLYQIDHLKLKPSEVHVLIGRNGSGKSTLLSSIIGDVKLFGGCISIEGNLISNLSQKERSQKIAVVTSTFDPIPYLTVKAYIALGRHPYTNIIGKLSKADENAIEESIQHIGIEAIAEKYTTAISDGERQLAAIARALAQDTPIILLDEPTAFLDYGNRIKILKILTKLASEQKKCILISSHDIDLCLELKIPMLLIDQKSRKLIQLAQDTSKSKILDLGFGIV